MWSRFNILFRSAKYGNFLYNSKSNIFYNLSSELYDKFLKIEKEPEKITDLLDHSLINKMKEESILVAEGGDDIFISKMQYMKRKVSFNCRTLSLVIVPTMSCNFKCPYCYEKDLPNITMTDEVENNLIDFINRHKAKCDKLEIYWHGGEPLLAYNTIESILRKVKKDSAIPLTAQNIVTNGYLFDEKICELFEEFPLNYIQITVDGLERTHNKNRIHKSGVPTYARIINNIDLILNRFPQSLVGVRMNIHNGNKNEYHKLYMQLTSRWKGKNCNVYPAFVLPQGGVCGVSTLTPFQKACFYVKLYKNYGMKNIDFLPYSQLGSCSAIYENHYVVDPDGILYKCWADLDMPERSIGSLVSGIDKWDFVGEYSIGSDKFSDKKCLKCKIFPICDGGCNRFRTDFKLYGRTYNICPIDSNGLKTYLEILYEESLYKNNKLQ